LITQCGVNRKLTAPEPTEVPDPGPARAGIEGLSEICLDYDTIRSVLISKAEAVFSSNDERYEATVSIYAIRDSLIYMSVVNSGFEIIRAAINNDSIIVIDRLNKVIYTSLVNKRLGYQNPVNFDDIQNLVSRYYLCDEIESAQEINFSQLGFNFNEPRIKKSIMLNRESLVMESFEFVHSETKSYFMGERSEEGFKIFSNFMVNDFEVLAKGGEITYNKEIELKMNMNRRKYSFVNF